MKTFIVDVCETVAGYEAITPVIIHAENMDQAVDKADALSGTWRNGCSDTNVEVIRVDEVPANHFAILKRYLTVLN